MAQDQTPRRKPQASRRPPQRTLVPRGFMFAAIIGAVLLVGGLLLFSNRGNTQDQFVNNIKALGYQSFQVASDGAAGYQASGDVTYDGHTCHVMLASRGDEVVVRQLGGDTRRDVADLFRKDGVDSPVNLPRGTLEQFLRRTSPNGC